MVRSGEVIDSNDFELVGIELILIIPKKGSQEKVFEAQNAKTS